MRRKRKHKTDIFRSYEEAHSYGRAMGRLTCVYEMAVKMRDSKDFDLNCDCKIHKTSYKNHIGIVINLKEIAQHSQRNYILRFVKN